MLTYAKMNMKNNMKRLWCKIMLKIGVEYIEGNECLYLYLYPFEELVQKKFFEKLINYELIMN
jgi:hypothetical protein